MDEAADYLEKLADILARSSKPNLEARLARLEALQTNIGKLETSLASLHPMEVTEFRNAVFDVLKDPRLDRAHKVAEITNRMEALKKKGVLEVKDHRDLVGLGLLLIAFPEPTLISDALGLGLIAVGLLLQKTR